MKISIFLINIDKRKINLPPFNPLIFHQFSHQPVTAELRWEPAKYYFCIEQYHEDTVVHVTSVNIIDVVKKVKVKSVNIVKIALSSTSVVDF